MESLGLSTASVSGSRSFKKWCIWMDLFTCITSPKVWRTIHRAGAAIWRSYHCASTALFTTSRGTSLGTWSMARGTGKTSRTKACFPVRWLQWKASVGAVSPGRTWHPDDTYQQPKPPRRSDFGKQEPERPASTRTRSPCSRTPTSRVRQLHFIRVLSQLNRLSLNNIRPQRL
jgi:hypothetical protein